jgi:hypothetical protein
MHIKSSTGIGTGEKRNVLMESVCQCGVHPLHVLFYSHKKKYERNFMVRIVYALFGKQ